VGVSVPVYSYTPLYVAKEKGFFDEQGLDVDINVFKSGTEQQQALVADAVLIGSGGVTEPLTMQAQGVDTAIFTFIQDALVYKIMAKPEIKTLDDLKGKTMAVSRAGALSEQIVKIALTKEGKDPSMLKYQQAGGSTQRFAALQAGAVDAAILDAPSNQLAQKAGYTMLVDVPKLLPGFPYEVGYAKKDAIAKNRDVFVRYTRGYIKGAEFVNDPKNKDEVIKIAAKFLDMPEADSRLAYEDVIGYFPKDGMPTLEGLKIAVDGVGKFGDIEGADKVKAEQLYFKDLVEAAKKP
jgi:NitT/TauT family transport system substrate-binding protein